jgi:DNA-directed RNA polymerase specialized sigma subunit
MERVNRLWDTPADTMSANHENDRVREGNGHGLRLVQSMANGSVDAWRHFLEEYAGLILDVVRRHLVSASEDEIRTVFVDLLKELHDGGLSKYSGQADLSTWLFVYSKRRVIDFWRARYGRIRLPVGANRLNEFDREVLQLYYVERLSLEIVVHTLNNNGTKINPSEIVGAIQRIENTVDRRYLKRLDREHQARMRGSSSVQFLEYLIHQRVEYEARVKGTAPDAFLLEREAGDKAERVRSLLSELSDEERAVIAMRFEKNMRAKEISDNLKLDGPRKVYTIIDRVMRKMRAAL